MTGIGPRARDESGDDNGDRAVSEVIAFVLVFAIIIGSVGVLYMTGFQSMGDFQEGEQMRNAERAMSALAENLNDVQRNSGVQERAGELSLRGGAVRTGANGTVLNISTRSENVTLGSVTYQQGSQMIAYEGGGVFRGIDGKPNQSVVVTQPRLTCNPASETAVISLINISGNGDERSISGDDTVELTMVEQVTHVETKTGQNGVNISVVDSPYENAWENALDRNGWEAGSCGDASTVTVRIVDAEIDF